MYRSSLWSAPCSFWCDRSEPSGNPLLCSMMSCVELNHSISSRATLDGISGCGVASLAFLAFVLQHTCWGSPNFCLLPLHSFPIAGDMWVSAPVIINIKLQLSHPPQKTQVKGLIMSPTPQGVIIVAIILPMFATIAVIARLYARRAKKSGIKSDDWTITLALVCVQTRALCFLIFLTMFSRRLLFGSLGFYSLLVS